MGKTIMQYLYRSRGKVFDPYEPKFYFWRTVMVPRPTMACPFPCILVTLSNGHGRIQTRFASIGDCLMVFALEEEEKQAIKAQLGLAHKEADQLEEDARLVWQRRRLPAGAKLARTDTGEIVSDAHGTYTV